MKGMFARKMVIKISNNFASQLRWKGWKTGRELCDLFCTFKRELFCFFFYAGTNTGTDPEEVIRNAFACFDEEGSGFIHEDR